MASISGPGKISYLQKVFYLTHFCGLATGALLPFLASALIGPQAMQPAFFGICLGTGFGLAAVMFLLVRSTLKKQLRQQLLQLKPLAGEISQKDETVEGLHQAVEQTVSQVEALVRELLSTIDRLTPHYRQVSDISQFLSERAREGIEAATNARRDVESMTEKQQQVLEQVRHLSERSQDEAALSRELSASLEEMASAMEHNTSQFLETTTSVDELAQTVREVSSRAEKVANSVGGTTEDLGAIGKSLKAIQAGAIASSHAANQVKKDAEDGLGVVKTSMEEMARIEQESQNAINAMLRLSNQTSEVAKIIEVIKELVSDTELLAFNAAIIAAKAGEDGKGFSVVAEEIRDLADRTTTSAGDIHRIVKAIGGETEEVMKAVQATAERINSGKENSTSTGNALRKIVDSSVEAAKASEQISVLTNQQEQKAQTLLEDAGRNLRSVQAIARSIQEQETALSRTQDGVAQMKYAADKIASGMAEQVRANHQFAQGLSDREQQIQAIYEATRSQLSISDKVFSHFAASERRLQRNTERVGEIRSQVEDIESLAGHLRKQTQVLCDVEDRSGTD